MCEGVGDGQGLLIVVDVHDQEKFSPSPPSPPLPNTIKEAPRPSSHTCEECVPHPLERGLWVCPSSHVYGAVDGWLLRLDEYDSLLPLPLLHTHASSYAGLLEEVGGGANPFDDPNANEAPRPPPHTHGGAPL